MPSLSDDGIKIAFVSYVDGDGEIFIVNSDGSGLTQLTSNTIDDDLPLISADGTKIAFTSIVDDDDSEIFIVNSDGSGLTQLTSNPVEGWMPSISADGMKIAFMSIEFVDYEISIEDSEIFIINSDGSGLTQLTFSGGPDGMPSISADGTKIAFLSLVDDDDYEIFIINSDGSGLTQLTSNTVGAGMPWINADGTKIAFCSIADNGRPIFLLELIP